MTTASISNQGRRWVAAVAAALASGALLWAASPAGGVGWLAWIALVPAAAVAVRLHGTPPGRLALPLAFGVSLELLLVPALPFGLARDQWSEGVGELLLVRDSPVLVVALVLVPLAVLGLYALRFPFLGTRSVLVGALAWTGLDVVRAKLDPSGLWGALFPTQHDTAAASIALLGGPWLITLTIVGVNLGLAGGGRTAGAAVACAVVVGIGGTLADEDPPSGTTAVAAVQPGYDTAERRPLLRNHLLRRYAASAHALIGDLSPPTRRTGAEIVAWPEAVVWLDPRETAGVRASLQALARSSGSTVVVPYFLRGPAVGAAVAFPPSGAPTRPAPKQRPMWFLGERGANRSGPPRPLGALGTMLGVDTQDPAVARTLVVRGAEVLVSSTHDWPALAVQQFAFARLWSRALGVPLVRADWRYESAILDRGRVLAHAPSGRAAVTASVASSRWTPYRSVGDWLGWAALAGAVVAAALRLRASAG